jgi:uncharacterized protein
MEWRGRRGSRNIEDRRTAGGGGGGGGRGAGIGGAGVIVVLLLGWFLGVDVRPLLQGDPGVGSDAPTELTAEDRAMGEFVSVTLADTEEVWAALFREQLGRDYRPATLVLFKGYTQSGCGGASEATGPFYCPTDRKVYLDTGFFTVLDERMGAGAISPLPMWWRMRSAIMCRTSWGFWNRPPACASRSVRWKATKSRSGWS